MFLILFKLFINKKKPPDFSEGKSYIHNTNLANLGTFYLIDFQRDSPGVWIHLKMIHIIAW